MRRITFCLDMVILLTLSALILGGCGGGNRIIDNRAGIVETSTLDLSALPQAEEDGIYTLGYGDVIDVLFLYNRNYSRENIKIRPDGRISYPYIGDIEVVGRTTDEIDSILTEKFSEIINDPDIAVMVREFDKRLVYVLGEVGNPGGYDYRPGQTLLNLLASGGGLNDDARKNNVVVIRRIAPDHIVGIEVNINDIIKGNHYDLDIAIRPYDIVMVPKSRISSAADFSNKMFDILAKPADLYLRGWQVVNVKTMYEFYRSVGRSQ